MSELETLGKSILDKSIRSLKGEYDGIPDSVKVIMPKAATLVARGAVAGKLNANEMADYKHAMAILSNVQVGGHLALNELMLDTAADILAAGIGMLRRVVGV